MRRYPHNSPQAAARLVALGLLADGSISEAELHALRDCAAHIRLGLGVDELEQVIAELLEDLAAAARTHPDGVIELTPRLVGRLMAEIDDRQLRHEVMDLTLRIAHADRHIHPGEAAVMASSRIRWAMPASRGFQTAGKAA